MSLAAAVEFIVTATLWLLVPIYCITRRWLFVAGITSLAGWLLPVILDRSTPDDTPGIGILMLVMAPPTLLLLAVGLISLGVRLAKIVFGDRVDRLGL